MRSTRAALGHLWCGTNVKKRELRELHMVNIRREVRSLRDTVNAELTSARNMHGSTHLAPPVDAAPLHPLNPLVAISSPSTADSRKGFSDVAMIDGKPLPASPDKSLPSRPPTQISIHSMPLMADAPTSTRIASDDVAVTDISAPITSPTAQEDGTAKEHLPSSPTAAITTTAQTHSSLLQDDGAHSRAFMRRSFNLSKQIVPSSSSIRTRLSQQFVEMIDSTRNRMRGERPAVEPLPSGGTSLGSDDLVAKSFFVHNDELEVDGDERRNESRRSRGDQPLKREFRYFNFWTPSRTRAGRSASIQDTHVHCALADASLAAYALDVEMLGDDICLVTPRDGQLLDHENGHRFHSVVAAINPNIAVKVSGENMPDSLPLGVCICCYGVVRAPLLLKMNITWSGGGYVQEDNEDKRPWWTSDALLCKDCPMLVHRSCSATVLHACPGAMDEGKVQSSFLKLWTALLSDYRMFLCDGTKRTTDMSMARFRTDDFVKHHSNDREMSAFFSRFCATQAFQQFVDDRADKTCTDNEVLFFDELIQAKRNRSVLKLNKDSTPFLEVRRVRCAVNDGIILHIVHFFAGWCIFDTRGALLPFSQRRAS